MKILELCLSPDLGGLELYALRCARELSHQHNVVGVISEHGKLRSYFDDAHIAYHVMNKGFHPLPLINAQALARIIDAEQVDVMHMHWGKDLSLAALAKKLSHRKPKLVYTRQMQITRPKQDRYHRFIYGQVDKLFGITQRVTDDLKRFLPESVRDRVEVLYYGVDAPDLFDEDVRKAQRQKLGISDDQFLVGLIGRIKEYKGQHLLVEAVELAASDQRNIAAVIVGRAMEPDYLEGLKQRVKAKGLEQQIQFLDFTNEPQKLMQACDAVALTTREETFGLVLVEAMRAGVAVIGTNSGGVPEIIDHGVNGLLFEPDNSEDLYAKIRKLAEDAELNQRLATAGKESADRRFNQEQHFQQLNAILERLYRA